MAESSSRVDDGGGQRVVGDEKRLRKPADLLGAVAGEGAHGAALARTKGEAGEEAEWDLG